MKTEAHPEGIWPGEFLVAGWQPRGSQRTFSFMSWSSLSTPMFTTGRNRSMLWKVDYHNTVQIFLLLVLAENVCLLQQCANYWYLDISEWSFLLFKSHMHFTSPTLFFSLWVANSLFRLCGCMVSYALLSSELIVWIFSISLYKAQWSLPPVKENITFQSVILMEVTKDSLPSNSWIFRIKYYLTFSSQLELSSLLNWLNIFHLNSLLYL